MSHLSPNPCVLSNLPLALGIRDCWSQPWKNRFFLYVHRYFGLDRGIMSATTTTTTTTTTAVWVSLPKWTTHKQKVFIRIEKALHRDQLNWSTGRQYICGGVWRSILSLTMTRRKTTRAGEQRNPKFIFVPGNLSQFQMMTELSMLQEASQPSCGDQAMSNTSKSETNSQTSSQIHTTQACAWRNSVLFSSAICTSRVTSQCVDTSPRFNVHHYPFTSENWRHTAGPEGNST